MASAIHGVQQVVFTTEPLVKFARSAGAAIGSTFKRWAAAQERAARRRLARQLSMADRRALEQIRTIRDRAAASSCAS